MVKTLIVDLPDKLNAEFRLVLIKVKGWKQGNIREAVIEAIEDWVKKNGVG